MKKTILIVDDIESDIIYLKRLLNINNKYNILSTINAQDSINIVKSNKIDLILLDIIMPKMDGYKVCSILKSNEETQGIPVIFVTSKIDEKSIVKGYESGAVDYVTKPYKQRELIAKIDTHLKLRTLIDELKYIATHDTMTGILNRGEFFRLSKFKFDENKNNLFAVMIDIDNFKQINDNYGHCVGDKVITKLAKIIFDFIKKDSLFGRIGGEEFALLCEYNHKNEIFEAIEIIRKIIENSIINIDNDEVLKFTASFGVAKIKENHNTIDDLLRDADNNLYEAKNSGKNKVVF